MHLALCGVCSDWLRGPVKSRAKKVIDLGDRGVFLPVSVRMSGFGDGHSGSTRRQIRIRVGRCLYGLRARLRVLATCTGFTHDGSRILGFHEGGDVNVLSRREGRLMVLGMGRHPDGAISDTATGGRVATGSFVKDGDELDLWANVLRTRLLARTEAPMA